MSNPSVGDKARYAAERVMEPILRRWFEIDLEPVNLDSNAENAAVDLSWALESAGLLLPIVIEGEAPTRKDGDDEATSEEPPPRAPRAEREALERWAEFAKWMRALGMEHHPGWACVDGEHSDYDSEDEWASEEWCPTCALDVTEWSVADALAAPAEERFPNGYPEDPVLGPYEDDADEED